MGPPPQFHMVLRDLDDAQLRQVMEDIWKEAARRESTAPPRGSPQVSSFTQLHNTSWWQPLSKELFPLMEFLFSVNNSESALSQRMENTGLQLCRTLDIQESHQVVSFLLFLPENTSWIHFAHPTAPHIITAVEMMPSSSRVHPQLHCVKF